MGSSVTLSHDLKLLSQYKDKDLINQLSYRVENIKDQKEVLAQFAKQCANQYWHQSNTGMQDNTKKILKQYLICEGDKIDTSVINTIGNYIMSNTLPNNLHFLLKPFAESQAEYIMQRDLQEDQSSSDTSAFTSAFSSPRLR